ncbi:MULTISPECIES: LysM peptidoglycan-binding domain-containing protein [unclassified Streptomyces]|uniref:LysM peptidoglycan-binding domain-containing protein n=1 Tax=unclassified Streptomyces TaxID=2593676 RepID=UPI002E158FBA|nr:MULTISPECIES: LysM peptidoglycan-binding domain-containing protein [unclassified Streptomyces]WSR26968.1 LysM peptidoglycan-binding domain-containing protein [Streptomyces sp. NBC_01205]
MGLFDFLKSDKKKQEAAEKASTASSADYAAKYTDAVAATKAAAERMAAAAPPKPAPAPPKAAPAPPRPAPTAHPQHTPTPTSAAHKAVPAAPAAKPMSASKRIYTVRSGDSLSAIARRELGNEARWRELYAMNRGVIGSNPELIHPGQVLTLPQ